MPNELRTGWSAALEKALERKRASEIKTGDIKF